MIKQKLTFKQRLSEVKDKFLYWWFVKKGGLLVISLLWSYAGSWLASTLLSEAAPHISLKGYICACFLGSMLGLACNFAITGAANAATAADRS